MTGLVVDVTCLARSRLWTRPPTPHACVLFSFFYTALRHRLALSDAKLTCSTPGVHSLCMSHSTQYTLMTCATSQTNVGPQPTQGPSTHGQPAFHQLYTRALFASPSRPTRPALREPSVYSAPTSTPVSSTPVSTCYVSGPVSGPPTHPSPHPPRPPP